MTVSIRFKFTLANLYRRAVAYLKRDARILRLRVVLVVKRRIVREYQIIFQILGIKRRIKVSFALNKLGYRR